MGEACQWKEVIHIPPLLLPAPTSRPTSWHHLLHPAHGGRKVLQNIGILPQQYMASQPRRPQLGTSRHVLYL